MTDGDRDIFTIGHSVHEIDAFIALLTRHGITAVADVRSKPVSRLQHFNAEALAAILKTHGIRYVPLGPELGARRDEREAYINGQAVYERVAELPRFRAGIARLARGASEHRIALMCAEKEPLDCHRTVLVCRHLRPLGFRILHILANGELEDHIDTERRMMLMTGVEPDLFQPDLTEADLVEQAYRARGLQLAYSADGEGNLQ